MIFAMFRTLSGPASGVTLTAGDGARPADDFAFADVNPSTRTTIDTSMTATGPNGVALMLSSALVEHSGVGGEPPGCAWQRQLAASIPGVLFVLEVWGETPSGALCP